MTIRRRLRISNILMIAVPLFVAAAVGLACIETIRYSIENGIRPGIHSSEDFPETAKKCELAAEHVLQEPPRSWQKKFKLLNNIFLEDTVSYRIFSEQNIVTQAGAIPSDTKKLTDAIAILGGEGFVSNGSCSLYSQIIENNNGRYRIEIYGTEEKPSYHALKIMLICCIIIFCIVVILTVWLTDRFLITFVFKRIEEPLDTLSHGVHELRDGNLSYRIVYTKNDEFLPVCEGFNDMADHLKESVESVKQHEANRTELIAGISHDLRTPITSILAYVEGLIDGIADTPDMQKKYLGRIKIKAQELEHLISQLFLFSKMELAEYPVHMEICSLSDVVHDVIESYRNEYSSDSCTISEELADAQVLLDRDLIARICGNCISNSVKYKKNQTVHITVSIRTENNNAVLSLSDDGPGVPVDSIKNIFTVFYRGDSARKNTSNGSGLGLAIAAKAVERMNGTITAENVLSGGLSIIIKLPLVSETHGEKE